MRTQARDATPYRGVLCVSSRYCSCWKRQLGGRTFSADPALACQRSLTQFYSSILLLTRAAGDRFASRCGGGEKSRKIPGPHPDHPVRKNGSTVRLLRIFRASTFTSAPSSAHDGFGLHVGAGGRSADSMSVLKRQHSATVHAGRSAGSRGERSGSRPAAPNHRPAGVWPQRSVPHKSRYS
jgi:hypothetical protein